MSNDLEAPAYPPGKEALLAKIEDGWRALMAAVEAVPVNKMALAPSGGWSVKDQIAHVTAWEDILLRHYIGGAPLPEVAGAKGAAIEDIDHVNLILFERDHDLTIEQVMDRAAVTHKTVIEKIQVTDWETLQGPHRVGDRELPSLLAAVAANTYEHYEEHTPQIEAARQR